MRFKPRTEIPQVATNAYYRHTGYNGGLNECLLINVNTGAVMPNCTGYAWGRWYELLGTRPNLSRGNAEDWFGYADGYSRGTVPKLGAIICYKNGGSLEVGHVAVVESIDWVNGTITCSNSGYTSGFFFLTTLKMSENYRWYDYEFQGFIYPPVNFIPYNKLPLIYYGRKR